MEKTRLNDARPSSRNAGRNSRRCDCQACPEIRSVSIVHIVSIYLLTYQIDVDLGVSEWSVSTVAPDNTLFGDNWCHLVDQLDAPVLVHIPLGIDEARIAVIILVEHL